ncbi:MAG: NUDIX domain-containing protein [Nanoarchaeota archaeon]|nr:NUDIX domain-containing protein [Nanoarchaeota archaeon]
MKIKKCVGAIIHNNEGRIFLMTSPKWKGWIIPGGEIESDETEEQSLKREILEELGIEIEDITRVGEKIKKAERDFYDSNVEFHFIDFFARAKQTNITPNEEISDYGWFTIDEALQLNLLDTTKELIEKFRDFNKD